MAALRGEYFDGRKPGHAAMRILGCGLRTKTDQSGEDKPGPRRHP
jgi:hypothetical protein